MRERAGEAFFPRLTVESVHVFEVLRLCGEGTYDELTDYLMDAVYSLARAGADLSALSANMPHVVFDRLREKSPVPLVSIVETARDEALRRKLHKIGLPGCTELPLMLHDGVTPVPCLDTMKIHIQALIGRILIMK